MQRVTALVVHEQDNVATVMGGAKKGEEIFLIGFGSGMITAKEDIPAYHKIALVDFTVGDGVKKYGVIIGRTSQNILKGNWVHIHCMNSLYDERSSHLDVMTGIRKEGEAL